VFNFQCKAKENISLFSGKFNFYIAPRNQSMLAISQTANILFIGNLFSKVNHLSKENA